MFYLYYLGIIAASLLATSLMPETMNNFRQIVEDEDFEQNEELLKFILICNMAVSILFSWYTVTIYIIGRTRN